MEEQGQIAPLSCTRGEAVVEEGKGWDDSSESGERCGFCAICLEKIALPEMALVKGCEHAYWFSIYGLSGHIYCKNPVL